MANHVQQYWPVLGLDPLRESVSNAVWYTVLADRFRFPDYIIAPEYYLDNGTKVDLVVLDSKGGDLWPVFAMEGKGNPCSDWQFTQAAAQARPYISQMKRMSNDRRYGMIVAGKQVAILAWSGGNDLQKVICTNLVLDTIKELTAWDIQNSSGALDNIFNAVEALIRNTAV
ncbi:hypothetical protein ACLX1H_011255 [Fusarium chlamydosporum]